MHFAICVLAAEYSMRQEKSVDGDEKTVTPAHDKMPKVQ